MAVTHAPFFKGQLQEYVYHTYPSPFTIYHRGEGDARGGPVHGDWVKIEEFDATMRYTTFSRGRSAVKLIWLDEQRNEWPMFISDADALLQSLPSGARVSDGRLTISGTWKVVKKGSNYGLKFVR